MPEVHSQADNYGKLAEHHVVMLLFQKIPIPLAQMGFWNLLTPLEIPVLIALYFTLKGLNTEPNLVPRGHDSFG